MLLKVKTDNSWVKTWFYFLIAPATVCCSWNVGFDKVCVFVIIFFDFIFVVVVSTKSNHAGTNQRRGSRWGRRQSARTSVQAGAESRTAEVSGSWEAAGDDGGQVEGGVVDVSRRPRSPLPRACSSMLKLRRGWQDSGFLKDDYS